MAAGTRPAPTWRLGGYDPMRAFWALLCNAKFALTLVGFACIACLIGVVLPQVPIPMRGNAAARSAWIELRREDFGVLTNPMDRLALFDVFHAWWFYGLWAVVLVAVTVCSVSRLKPTYRGVHRPPKEVGERYFETAHHRADFAHAGGAEALAGALRARRYTVERIGERDGATLLFAERFRWSAYGTFLSHLALLMLLLGGLLTTLWGFEQTLVLAESTPAAPVFSKPGPNQIFVTMNDAVKRVDERGNIIDYRSQIEVRKGTETVRCTTTVNDPCRVFGYSIHQAAFFDDIGWLTVAGPTGALLYSDVIDFNSEATTVPAFRVTRVSDGAVMFAQELPQLSTDPGASAGRADDVALGQVAFQAGAGPNTVVAYTVAWRVVGDELRVALSGGGLDGRDLRAGEDVTAGGYRVAFEGARSVPAMRIDDMPGAASAENGVVVQMPRDADGEPYLVVTGLADGNVVIRDDEEVAPGNGYTYGFGGRVEASGVQVKRDAGDTFIWLGVGAAIVGLCITFYVPRRRLWIKVAPERTYIAGIAEKRTRLGTELRKMGAELGSKDALRPEDAPERY